MIRLVLLVAFLIVAAVIVIGLVIQACCTVLLWGIAAVTGAALLIDLLSWLWYRVKKE